MVLWLDTVDGQGERDASVDGRCVRETRGRLLLAVVGIEVRILVGWWLGSVLTRLWW